MKPSMPTDVTTSVASSRRLAPTSVAVAPTLQSLIVIACGP